MSCQRPYRLTDPHFSLLLFEVTGEGMVCLISVVERGLVRWGRGKRLNYDIKKQRPMWWSNTRFLKVKNAVSRTVCDTMATGSLGLEGGEENRRYQE